MFKLNKEIIETKKKKRKSIMLAAKKCLLNSLINQYQINFNELICFQFNSFEMRANYND